MRPLVLWTTLLVAEIRGFVIVETVDNIAESHMYYHRTAQFGKQEPYSVTGWLSVPERVDLCSNEGIRNTTYANSIVLALRGNCSFFHKAVVAEGAGAIGIVIGNDQWDARELRMIREDDEETRGLPDVTIPVATIAGIDYQNAMQKIMNGMKRNATFGAKLDQLYDVEYSTKLKFNIVPALVLILVWATIIGMYFCRKYLIRYISRQHRVSAMRVVPTVEYRAAESKEEDEEEDDTGRVINSRCVICIEDFKDGEELKILPCRHGFHPGCIDRWLADHSDRCPVCNQSLLAPSEIGGGSVEMKSMAEGRYSSRSEGKDGERLIPIEHA
ncbi:hypothetical protein AAMO2058_000488000 [Amorphochlora amoebiformis]